MKKPKFPESLPSYALRLFGDDADDSVHIEFKPVPRIRERRNGWTEQRQRAFIAALARCGSVSAAARAIGMTARSAYRLLDAEGADDFARAWDEAIHEGFTRVQMRSLERSLNGDWVPIYRNGKLWRVEKRHCDRLAIALLSSSSRTYDGYRIGAASRRRKLRQDFAELDRQRAAEKAEIEARGQAYWKEVDRIMEAAKLRRPEPRVRAL
jgi:hypothetical protein